ncbi:MAG: hypothetical protein GOU99_03315, partial [Candidatus Altiarchaeota archaeon]|nr:hypothetical protein [Candidatus Altiarchaeota archaeon]
QLHTGTGVGKMEGSPIPIRWLGETLRQDTTGFEPLMLEQKWIDTIKPVMPVASGGLHPGQIEAVVEVYGTTDLTIQAGGGIHGHPGGTLTGARAMRQAADAVADGIPLNTMYKEKEELLGAIELWGITPAEKIKNMFERFEKDKEITRTRLLSSGMAGIEWFNQEFSIKS